MSKIIKSALQMRLTISRANRWNFGFRLVSVDNFFVKWKLVVGRLEVRGLKGIHVNFIRTYFIPTNILYFELKFAVSSSKILMSFNIQFN